MTTRGQVNSNFYQIVNVDANGNPTEVKPQYINVSNVANANFASYANIANTANSVSVSNVTGIGNIATTNYDGNSNHVLYGNGIWANIASVPTANANYANYAGNAFSVSGSNVVGYVANATHSNVSDVANSVSAANISGTVNLANYATVANSVSVANVSGIGNIATINLDGSATDVLYGNGSWAPIPTVSNVANSNYANFAGTAYNVSGSNVSGIVGNASHANIADLANSVAGANVTGTVADAVHATVAESANSVAAANVIGTVANANFATYSGTAYSVSGSNVSGTVANANYSNYSNIANTANSVSVANVSGIGNIATINLDGSVSNVLYGNGVWGPVAGNISANYATFAGTIVNNSQPNITSLGTLTSLSVTGNISSGNANLGNLAVANFFSGDGGLLSNISSANIVGSTSVRFEVKNTSGGTLTKGTPIYVTGSVGASGVAEVHASRADTAGTMGCVGLLEQTLTNNATGTAMSVGQLDHYDTSTYSIGQQLYVAATGGLTNVRPNDGYIVQSIGIVSRVNGSTGIIEVNIWNINGLPNLDNGNIWVGTTSNGYPVQQVLSTANVGNATYAVHVLDSSQPNITSTGTLTGLSVTGNVNVTGNINVTGNLNYSNVTDLVVGDPLIYIGANNTGNIYDLGMVASYNDGTYVHTGIARNHTNGYWTFFDGVVAEPTTVIDWANATYPTVKGGNFTATGNVTASYILGNGSSLTSITGANVTGYVANSTHSNTADTANLVALANVSGIGNIASLNITGSSSNVLYGNGVFAAIPTVTSVANANYANYAGNAFSVDAGNIVGNVNLANYATVANSVAGSNVSGQVGYAAVANSVAVANVSGIGNIATINLDGNTSNWLRGDGVWANIAAGGANANYANYAGNAFSVDAGNIVGTVNLANYATVANTVAGANVTGQVNYAAVANSVAGANVSGQVNYAATANSVAVANVSGIGNIATINLNGNTAQVLYGNGTFATVSSVANATAANTILSNTSTGNNYVMFTNSSANGWATPVKVTGILANLSTNTLYATTFSGSLTGTASNANAVLTNTATSPTNYLVFAGGIGNGYFSLTKVSGIYANLGNNAITATTFVGNVTGSSGSANSVAVANVSGIGNIATINLDGNSSNLLYGNGTFAPISITSVANANYANYANVSNVANSVAVANVTGIGNIATINIDGSSSNVLYGNGVWAGVSATSANFANYAGNVTVAAQGNITSLGTLTNLNVTGNANVGTLTANNGNITATNGAIVVVSPYSFWGDGGGLENIPGGNVTGNVPNATFSTTAGTVTTAAQPNITSTGTLTSLTVTGNISGGNISTAGLANLSNVQLKIYEETVLASANTSTSISPNVATGTIFRYTANNNFSFNGLTSAVAGTSATVIITQDATGSRTLTSTMKFTGGFKTLSTAAGSIDIICVFYDGTTYYASLTRGYA